MTFVIRRVFHERVGCGDKLKEQVQSGNILARVQRGVIIPRILSDQSSGTTDRVAMEWEAESLAELEAIEEDYPESQ